MKFSLLDWLEVFAVLSVCGLLVACFSMMSRRISDPFSNPPPVAVDSATKSKPLETQTPTAAELPPALERVAVETKSTFYQTAGGDDLGGVSYVSPATTIHWRPEWIVDSERASVEQVIAAAVARLEFMQSRPQASDRNARALWELNQALQILREGTP